MLENGTVINNKMISGVHSFNKACTIASQIALAISSGQYGGQTMSLQHLSPFVRKSKERWKEIVGKDKSLSPEQVESISQNLLKQEISDGIKTLNYQLNTFMSCNGRPESLAVVKPC